MKQSCVITGLGIISSLGLDPGAFWRGLVEGTQAVEPVYIPGQPSPLWQSPVSASFTPKDFVDDPKVLRNASRFALFAMAAAEQGRMDARLDDLPEQRTAVITRPWEACPI